MTRALPLPIEPIIGEGGGLPRVDTRGVPPRPINPASPTSDLLRPPSLPLPALPAPQEMLAFPPPRPQLALPAPPTYPLLTGPKPPQYVVRGGLSAPEFLQRNAEELIKEGHPGLYGISAAMDPNSMLDPGPIALGAKIPHPRLTWTTWPELDALGYKTIPTPYDDRTLHASILLKPGETTLSIPEADKLSALLQKNIMDNPGYVKPPKPPKK
jgi:hypothetical protein